MFNVVLIHPEIPNNTGAIGRLCVNTDATLHLIRPLGFDISEKAVRRAGLDYWHKLDLCVWEDAAVFFDAHPNAARYHLATTKTTRPYFEADFQPGDYLFFGSETKGLPETLLQEHAARCITIPMGAQGRSLNLAISCGIILYRGIEQHFTTFKEHM